MFERRRVQTALLSGLLLLGTTTPAWTSGPSGSGSVLANYQVCKGGPSKGADCMFDVDCPSSKCVLDWVTGKGTTLPGTITAFMDDEVRDFMGGVDTNNQAIAVILEVKANGENHLLSEVYQNHVDPTVEPQVLGWGGTPYFEDDWFAIDCEDFLYARPDLRMNEALLALAGLPATKVPVVAAVKKKTQYSDHDGSDPIGTSVKCKLKIRFLNEP